MLLKNATPEQIVNVLLAGAKLEFHW